MIPSNTVSNYRAAVKRVLDGLDEARTVGLVIASQGGAAIMFDQERDFAGTNGDITVSQLTSAMSSIEAIEALVTAGGNAHLTNLNKMRA